MIKQGKVTVIGAGNVGATTAYTLAISGSISELVLLDLNRGKAEGDILDINHGLPFINPLILRAGDYSDAKSSEIVIITAGVGQRPDETRLQLLQRNQAVFKNIIDNLSPYIDAETTLLVVTNPVDILTHYTLKISGFPANKVIGSGTVLDTSRFRYLLSLHTGIDARDIEGFVLGEHGDSEVACWSGVSIGSMTMEQYCAACGKCSGLSKFELADAVKKAAYEIINKKGATYYAIALATRRIVECILRDENSILTVSTLLTGQYGINDVCISVPAVLNRSGVTNILTPNLTLEELEALRKSAEVVRNGGQ